MILILLSLFSFATDRIETKSLNRSSPKQIYMTYGRSTVIFFPCNIISFSDGPTKDIQANLNERNSRMIEVWFTKNSPEPQELKVFCQEEHFVFDIMPNRTTHQSIFEVSRSFKANANFVSVINQPQPIKKPKILKVVSSSQTRGSK